MKDTKIFVDIDDELTFVAEKIIHAQTNRVILIIPEKSEILSSLNFSGRMMILLYPLERV